MKLASWEVYTSLFEELQKADKERFDGQFDSLFAIRPDNIVISDDFFLEELKKATDKFPLIEHAIDKADELMNDLIDHGLDEETARYINQGVWMGYLALAAYATSEAPDAPESA
jgi:hypothetical protein